MSDTVSAPFSVSFALILRVLRLLVAPLLLRLLALGVRLELLDELLDHRLDLGERARRVPQLQEQRRERGALQRGGPAAQERDHLLPRCGRHTLYLQLQEPDNGVEVVVARVVVLGGVGVVVLGGVVGRGRGGRRRRGRGRGRAARGRLRRNVVRDPLPVPTGSLLLLGNIAHRRTERVLARLDGGCLVDFRRPLRDEPQIRAAVHLRNVALEHFECIRDRCQLTGPRLRPRVPIARLRLALGGEVVEEIFVRFHSSRRFLKVRAERGELLRQLRARGPFLLLGLVHHIDIVAASLG